MIVEVPKYRSLITNNDVVANVSSGECTVAPVNSIVFEGARLTKSDAVKQADQMTMAEVESNGEWRKN